MPVGISKGIYLSQIALSLAEMLKVADVTGTLEEGKSADLLVIDGNPLENIRNICVENMKVIMKEGRFVKRH